MRWSLTYCTFELVLIHSPTLLATRFDQLNIYLRDNKFTGVPTSLCDDDNHSWNMGGVAMFGCNALMCPPGTANYHGRQSSQMNKCMKCESNTDLYGQTTCNGMPLLASSGSRIVHGAIATIVSLFLVGVLMI